MLGIEFNLEHSNNMSVDHLDLLIASKISHQSECLLDVKLLTPLLQPPSLELLSIIEH